MANERTGNMYRYSSLRNNGRKAGIGAWYDDYGDESGGKDYEKHDPVRFPRDNIRPESLNGPVISYKKGASADECNKEGKGEGT